MDLEIKDDSIIFYNRINYQGNYCGTDHPDRCMSFDWWKNYPIQNFGYVFNSWGFRSNKEYSDFIGKPVVLCLGDSLTSNLGGPIEHSWPSILQQHFDIPCLNFGTELASNDGINLIYEKACKLFDVRHTFVTYSLFHRRFTNENKFVQKIYDNNVNFEFFQKNRIPNAVECTVYEWAWAYEETKFLDENKIFYLKRPTGNYRTHQELVDQNREWYINKKTYNKFKGWTWPSYKKFINGADPHSDMFTDEFGNFVEIEKSFHNRDGLHLNYECNRIYADYMISKVKNES